MHGSLLWGQPSCSSAPLCFPFDSETLHSCFSPSSNSSTEGQFFQPDPQLARSTDAQILLPHPPKSPAEVQAQAQDLALR